MNQPLIKAVNIALDNLDRVGNIHGFPFENRTLAEVDAEAEQQPVHKDTQGQGFNLHIGAK